MARITEAFFRSPPIGEHTDDLTPNLILVVRKSKTGRKRKSWLVRVVVDGKRRKVGFTCGLAEARKRAPEIRQALLDGKDLSKRAKASQRAAMAVRCHDFRRGRDAMAAARAETAPSDIRRDPRACSRAST